MWRCTNAVQTAVGGFPIGQILQGEAVYNLTVRYQKPYRRYERGDSGCSHPFPFGERVFAQLTNVQVKDAPTTSTREANSRYAAISV